MKSILAIFLSVCCLLASCAGETQTPIETTPTKAPIPILSGGKSILVPPTLSPVEITAAPAQTLVQLTLTNRSDWKVCYVYISPPEDTSWGDDWLGTEETIGLDEDRIFQIQSGIYDVRAENCDYIGLEEQYGFDVSGSTGWEVNNPTVLDSESFQEIGDWKTGGSGAQGAIADETYILTAGQQDGLAYATAGKNLDNFVLTVEATLLQPDTSAPAGFGLMCRVQSNGDGYLFMIREDGYYAVFRNDHNERIPLVDWQASADVLSDTQLNVIEASCDGENLALRINGITVEKLTDANYSSGDIGMAVLPGKKGNTQVQFDNLVVTEP